MYQTRIGLQTMFASDRRRSGASEHFRGNFSSGIIVTPVVARLMLKISAKTECSPLELFFLDLMRVRALHYRISLRHLDALLCHCSER
jgi:hypothetical protein